MAKKYEFKPDKERSGIANKLFLTRLQQKNLLKWLLYTVVLLALSLAQDVLLCQVRIFGSTTELVPCGIFLICLAEGMEGGCVYALVASACYLFSGSAAGYHSLVLLTAIGIFISYFRQSYLRKGFAASMLCVAVGLAVYELAVFAIALFLGQTYAGRLGAFALTAGLTFLSAPVLYPVVGAISKIGGEAWKE